ncbi:heme/hemin ABC transporter substrate-binding protein [Aquipseudomonas alcaligenes]|uniref:ABC transporter substrate-binding protein n=1 Tax=Aquipseudomonas alcaligenes TaxID=43263 RepID=A0AA42SRF1_AQUAC|nr:ABC transporter substrate-binding protein [Pseudomonas alcaligenes]MDH1053683.1 ABC transporter substrate-binding protein [Pseudomonas alcaligenes]
MRLANCVLLCSSLLFSHAAAAAELPQRWVSSGGSLSEWVVRLGGEGRLVGVDTTSLHPQSLRQLPSVGYQRALSAEGVLSLRPDILIGSEEMGPPPVVVQIAAAGVRVESLSAKPDLATLERNVLRLGELLGVPAQAREQMAAYRQQLQDQAQWVAEARRTQAPPRVVMLLGHAGSNLMAGGESPVAHQGYKALSSEALLALDPQVLIVADRTLHGEEARQALLKHNPLLQQTSAVRDGRLLALDPTLLVGGLGPRLPEGLAELSAAFYPSAQALTAELDR